MKSGIIGGLIMICLYPISGFADNCIEHRYAFDVGSGAIKTTANKVDKCKGEIVEKIGEHNSHIKYESCLQHQGDVLVISKECIHKTKEVIQDIEQAYGMDCATANCAGVATAWARKASNTQDLLKLFKAENIYIEVLPQDDEGKLGFYTAGAHHVAKASPDEKEIVWDLGGGSFQISTIDDEKNIHVYNGKYGVESYEKIIRKHYLQDGATYLDKEKLDKAIDAAVKRVGNKIRKDMVIRNKLQQDGVVVYAIGRPMYLGIKEDLYLNDVVTQEDIYKAAGTFSGKTIEEIKKIYPLLPDHYLNQAQTALVLVYGVMKGAGIEKMHILNSRATDYISIDERYWN